jgi:hypothetical protein
MCNKCKKYQDSTPTKEYRLSDYFDKWWDIYLQSPKEFVQPEQFKAVNAIRTCRTAALGVDIYACPECGEISEVYHSCKNRFCPTCSWRDTVQWADRMKKSMLNVPHRHVVFTLPHSLNPIIKRNQSQLLNVFMRVTTDVFRDWMGSKFKLRVGTISVLHTFGEAKNYHPHIHMIVTWGGINKDTGGLQALATDYVNYEFLQQKFRCKFEDELIRLFDEGMLEHKYSERKDFMNFIRRINKTQWVVHLEPPMDIPAKVIRYIGRYSKRACLSEYKITKMEGEYIGFKHKDYKKLDYNNKPIEKTLELHYNDFFPLLLQHVPMPYFRIVRYYGIYATKVYIPKEYLYNGEDNNEEEQYEYNDPRECKTCQIAKIYQYTEVIRRKKEWYFKNGKIEPNLDFTYKRAIA